MVERWLRGGWETVGRGWGGGGLRDETRGAKNPATRGERCGIGEMLNGYPGALHEGGLQLTGALREGGFYD